jgi:cold shock CspA family protein
MSETGVLAMWDFQRSFGFIRPTQGIKDVFVHRRELRMQASDFRPGMKVRFEVGLDVEGKVEAQSVEALR